MKRKLLIFDGSNVVMRAMYAVPSLSTRDGFPTNAIVGTINIVLSNIIKHKPTHVLFVLDGTKPTFRHIEYPPYKATRDRDPATVKSVKLQRPVIKDLLKALGIRVMVKQGKEADDLIGAVAHKASRKKFEVKIVTNDKDIAQSIRKNVTILKQDGKTNSQIEIDLQTCADHYGVTPDRIPCMLMALGDKVDNLPGLHGVGNVTVKKLIATAKRLEDSDTSVLSKAQRKTFEEAAETFPLMRRLVTLQLDVIDYKLSRCKLGEPDMRRARSIAKAIESNNLRVFVDRYANMRNDN